MMRLVPVTIFVLGKTPHEKIEEGLELFADLLLRRGHENPYVHIGDYMKRWWIEKYSDAGIAVRVHEILKSDPDLHPHDHPWSFVSIVLSGGYLEGRPRPGVEGKGVHGVPALDFEWYGPGSVILRKHTDFHRILILEGGRAVTLFIPGEYRHEWGFLVDGQKVSHNDYERFGGYLTDEERAALKTKDPAKYQGR